MILRNLFSPKNARVSFLALQGNQGLWITTARFLNTTIRAPKDRTNVESIILDIGDRATIKRKFTTEDVKYFAIAAQDKHASHLAKENSMEFFK